MTTFKIINGEFKMLSKLFEDLDGYHQMLVGNRPPNSNTKDDVKDDDKIEYDRKETKQYKHNKQTRNKQTRDKMENVMRPTISTLELMIRSDISLFEHYIRQIGLKIVGLRSTDPIDITVQSESVTSIASVITDDINNNVDLSPYQTQIKRLAEDYGYIVAINENKYSINVAGSRRLTSDEILKILSQCPQSSDVRNSMAAIEEIERNGIRYSNQDFDVLSSALDVIDKNTRYLNSGDALRSDRNLNITSAHSDDARLFGPRGSPED